MLIKPIDLNWYLMKYKNDTDTLLQSDLEALRNVPPPENCPEGQHTALIVEFSLPSSVYATMALREILKSDTSVASQVSLHENVTRKHSADDEPSTEDDVTTAKQLKIDETVFESTVVE